MTSTLTLQACFDHQWQDVAYLRFDEDYRLQAFGYLETHGLSHYLQDNARAVSITEPVELFERTVQGGWLMFLDDIMPAGASRRYWLQQLGLHQLSDAEQRYQLLKQATLAPIGHLRIKEAFASVNVPTVVTPRLFDLSDVVNRQVDFLEYATQYGVVAGGATGAGGEAPKLVLRLTAEDQVWIDHQQDHACTDVSGNQGNGKQGNGKQSNDKQGSERAEDGYYLVKFPRGKRTDIDCEILRAEYHYYHELTQMGMATIATQGMRLIEGERYPSLWLPRFDVQGERFAMESVYAMLKQPPATRLYHGTVIRQLLAVIEQSHMVAQGFVFDKEQFVIDWVRRDLLNIAFGNSDNHGRNTAFLRDTQGIWLAPIFDFAPMKADPEGITRSTVWGRVEGKLLEAGGEYDFVAIAESLADLIAPSRLLDELRHTALQLLDLPQRLRHRGVSDSILNYPALAFAFLPERLADWGLL